MATNLEYKISIFARQQVILKVGISKFAVSKISRLLGKNLAAFLFWQERIIDSPYSEILHRLSAELLKLNSRLWLII